jgi:hypothetical protein
MVEWRVVFREGEAVRETDDDAIQAEDQREGSVTAGQARRICKTCERDKLVLLERAMMRA